MGNKPSAPAPPPPPANTITSTNVVQTAPPPPTIPVCDAACQKQKEIDGLKLALDQATTRKDSDPQGYQQARINYYRAVNGDVWVTAEKQRIANEEIGPDIKELTDEYNKLKEQKKNQGTLLDLVETLKYDQAQGQEELKYINNQTFKNVDQANLLNRRLELGDVAATPMSPYVPLMLQAVMVILGILIAVALYRRITRAVTQPTVMPAGGKRLPLHVTR